MASATTSYGVICFCDLPGDLTRRVLLVRRRDTVGFVEFVRGNSSERGILPDIVDEMTNSEKELIVCGAPDDIWNALGEYRGKAHKRIKAIRRIGRLQAGGVLRDAVAKSGTNWTEQEWEIPKGRKMVGETDCHAACREFEEETRMRSGEYIVLPISPVLEEFTGSDKIRYRHVYYVAIAGTPGSAGFDPSDLVQKPEISAVRWVSEAESLSLIRRTQPTKKHALASAYKIISLFRPSPALLACCSHLLAEEEASASTSMRVDDVTSSYVE